MKTTAKEYACSAEAGLLLKGQGKDGKPVFIGGPKEWKRYGELVKWTEDTGMFPWAAHSSFFWHANWRGFV